MAKPVLTYAIIVFMDIGSFNKFGEFREFVLVTFKELCLQCFDAVGWTAGRASGL